MDAQNLSLLLSLSTAIAAVRDRHELFALLYDRLQAVLQFDEAVFVFYDPTLTHSRHVRSTRAEQYMTNTDYQYLMTEWLPTAGSPHGEICNFEGPRVVPLSYWQQQYPTHAGVQFMQSAGLIESVIMPLRYGDRLLGTFEIYARQSERFSSKDKALYCGMADQIAVAVANILANEEVLELEQEKTLLLSLSEDMATIRHQEDLWRVMMEKVRPLVNFDDAVVVILTNQDTHYNHFLSVETTERRQHQAYKKLYKQSLPLQGTMIDYLFAGEDLFEWDVASFWPRFHEYPGLILMKETGLNYSVAIKLRWASRVIGQLHFHFNRKAQIQTNRYALYQAIVNQIAVAVANILANEEILEREQEKALLLSLSEDMATIRDREDLWRVMMEKVRPLVHFDDAVVFVSDAQLNRYYVLLAEAPRNRRENPHYSTLADRSLPLEGSVEEWIIGHNKPFICSTVEFSALFPDAPGVQLMQAVGIQDSLLGILRHGGQIIGSFHIHSEQANFFHTQQVALFQAICDQVAVAVANILANEEILKREQEKVILLSISEQLATIRDKHDLFGVIFDKLKPLFSFDDAVVVVNDHSSQFIQHLLHVDTSDIDRSVSDNYRQIMGAWLPIKDSPFEEIVTYSSPRILPLDHFHQRYPDYIGNRVMNDFGLLEMVFMPLRYANRLIGILIFHSKAKGFFTEDQMPLFRNVADQMAVAVSNLLANEEILEREQEKATLLSISEQLATIRDKHDLFGIIFDKLKPAFKFDEAVIVLCDIERTYTRHLHTTNNPGFDQNGHYQTIMREQVAVSGTPYEEFLFNEGPEIYTYTYLSGRYPNHIGVQVLKDFGLVESVFMPLRYGGNVLGTFEFHSNELGRFTPSQIPLLRNLADQMAVAVSNLLANEEILEREQGKSLQVAVHTALTTRRPWSERFVQLAEAINEVVPLHFLGFVGGTTRSDLFEASRQQHGPFVFGTGERLWSEAVKNEDIAAWIGQVLDAGREPGVNVGEQYEALRTNNRLVQQGYEAYNLRSTLYLPIELTEGQSVLLILGNHNPYAFTKDDLSLLLRIRSQLALALSNHMAFEQIARLKQQVDEEKTYLQEEINTTYNFREMVGSNPALQDIFRQVSQVAPSDVTVLIGGETGTGKELIARAIHELSPRKDRVLVKVNCAALPANLIESELFGHEKGSFTGAISQRIGKFELANGGTIFLDEVGELPLDLQTKLLRVLQEREFERLGGNKVLKTDFRVIAATNRSLEREVDEGRFRADLYYRLNVFPLTLPPLRERRDDIPLLAQHFARKYGQRMGKSIKSITHAALQEMCAYAWPGNVRELEHIIERAVVLATTPTLDLAGPLRKPTQNPPPVVAPLQIRTLREAERELILAVLQQTNGRVRGPGGAAEILAIEPNTLDARMKKLGVVRQHTLQPA